MSLEADLAAGRPIPWLADLAATIADEDPAGLADDAGTVARSLASAADLFELPAVCTTFDRTLVAEAVGCETDDGAVVSGVIETVDDAFDVDIAAAGEAGRVPTFLDATERLADTADAAVLGGVPGPALLAEQLLADPERASEEVHEEAVFTAGELSVELTNAYLDADADGVALLEPDGLDAPRYRDAAEPVNNVLGHYAASGVVVTERVAEGDIGTAGAVGFDAITGGIEDPSVGADADSLLRAAERAEVTLGVGVPDEAFTDGPEAVADFREPLSPEAVLSSEWTVPQGTPPEALNELMGSADT